MIGLFFAMISKPTVKRDFMALSCVLFFYLSSRLILYLSTNTSTYLATTIYK